MSVLDDGPVLVKRYDGQRLYHTSAARYITLDDIMMMRVCGIHVVIEDADTGRDITKELIFRLMN